MTKTPPVPPQLPADDQNDQNDQNEQAAQADLESGTVEMVGETELSPEDTDATQGEQEFEPYVQWVGASGQREVTQEQWYNEGITDQDTVIWTRDSPRVPMSRLSEAALRRLQAEQDFQFVYEAPKEGN